MGKMVFVNAVEEPTLDDYVLEKHIRPFGLNKELIEFIYEDELNVCENHGCMRVRHKGTYVKLSHSEKRIVADMDIKQFKKLLEA